MKRHGMLVCSLMLIALFLVGCSNQVGGDETIYYSNKVKVIETEFTERNYGCYSWAELTKEEAFDNTSILSGTISNVREAVVEFSLDGRTMTSPITLFDMINPNVVFEPTDSINNKKTITIGVGYNSGTFAEGLPILSDGKHFLAFCCATTIRSDDVLEIDKYADFWVWNPNTLLIEGTKDMYIVSDFFSEYLADEERIKDSLDLTEEKLGVLFEISDELDLVERGEYLEISDNEGVLNVLTDRYRGVSSDLRMMLESGYIVSKSNFEGIVQAAAQEYS